MENKRICPSCQKPLAVDVPLGLCPECLIKAGFPSGVEKEATLWSEFVPPPIEELAKLFPQLEILELVAAGMSNREIAGKLYVSENTVKTHCARAFDKLGAKRRTQAVQLGKELGLIR